MDMQMVYSLFKLFSGEQDTEKYLPLLMAAVQEVKSSLFREEDIHEVRLCYLAAAVANLRYTQIFGAKEKALVTYAGNISREVDMHNQVHFAEQLVRSYRALCSDLLKENEFVFKGVRG